MKCQNLWDTFLEIGSLSYPRVVDLLLYKKEARKEGESVGARAALLLLASEGQPFFAQAQYFFSLDSRSAEMQGAVAAPLARIVTAVGRPTIARLPIWLAF